MCDCATLLRLRVFYDVNKHCVFSCKSGSGHITLDCDLRCRFRAVNASGIWFSRGFSPNRNCEEISDSHALVETARERASMIPYPATQASASAPIAARSSSSSTLNAQPLSHSCNRGRPRFGRSLPGFSLVLTLTTCL